MRREDNEWNGPAVAIEYRLSLSEASLLIRSRTGDLIIYRELEKYQAQAQGEKDQGRFRAFLKRTNGTKGMLAVSFQSNAFSPYQKKKRKEGALITPGEAQLSIERSLAGLV